MKQRVDRTRLNGRRARTPSFVAVTALAVLAAACGSDGDSAASVEEFCSEFAALEAEESSDELSESDVAMIRDLATRAPAEIRDDLETMADVMGEVLEIDEADFEALFELVLSPEMIAAGTAIEEFGVEQCGFEPEEEGDGSISFSELDDAEPADTSDTDGDAFVPDVSGVDDPLYDDFFDDPVDPDVASLDGLKAHLDLEYTDAAWRTSLSSFGYAGSEWTIGGSDLGDDAAEVCAATAAYLVELAPDATIVVVEVEFEPEYAETPVVSGDTGGDCAPV